MAVTPPTTMRIDTESVELLQEIAQKEDRSLSYVVNRFIKVGLIDYAGGLPDQPNK